MKKLLLLGLLLVSGASVYAMEEQEIGWSEQELDCITQLIKCNTRLLRSNDLKDSLESKNNMLRGIANTHLALSVYESNKRCKTFTKHFREEVLQNMWSAYVLLSHLEINSVQRENV